MHHDLTTQPAESDLKWLTEQRTLDLNARYGAPHYTPLGAFIVDERDPDGALVGGVVGMISGPWLYVDELWVDARQRGQGYGVRLMGAIEQAAAERGAARVFLGTTSFQAPDFYARLGYETTGEFQFASAYSQYMLVRDPITPYALPGGGPAITVESPPDPARQAALAAALEVYNEQYLGTLEQSMVGAALLRDEDGTLAGGALAMRVGALLTLHNLWVIEAARQSDHPAAMVADLVAAGQQAGCITVLAQTDDLQALPWLEQAGFAASIRVDDFPNGRTSVFLKRDLA